MTRHQLSAYLSEPLGHPHPNILQAIESGPMRVSDALALRDVGRLLDPAPLPCETGWCTLPDGVGYVAVRTRMPKVSGEMVDWWFDWHPRESLRYRAWHPQAHLANSLEEPSMRGAKAHWGAVHHPVEDVGIGVVHARIEFRPPIEMGMKTNALDLPSVATVVCGYAGDDRLRVRHTPMFHVFLREREGVSLRSHFWLGGALRPLPLRPLALTPLDRLFGSLGERLLNNRSVRRRAIPHGTPRALAVHCSQEYSNLSELLPELYARHCPASVEVPLEPSR